MATYIIMPRQGQSVESCLISSWEKQEGDTVNEGDLLFTYETDKTAFEEHAKTDGVLLKILARVGDDVPVLDNIAIIGQAGEDIADMLMNDESNVSQPASKKPVDQVIQEPDQLKGRTTKLAPKDVKPTRPLGEATIKISPRARQLANRRQLDYREAEATGPNGRIIERDIITLTKRPQLNDSWSQISVQVPDVGSFSDRPLSSVRRAIAESMHQSLANMAQLTHSFSFDATEIIAYRQRIKAHGRAMGLSNITYNDMILYAVSRVLTKHPEMNSHFLSDGMRLFDRVHLGMAVDTPRGLLVPTVLNSDQLSLSEIADQSKQLAEWAKTGSISPDHLKHATFTVSNLGVYGVEHFTPVINPPQVGIIGVNNMQVRFKMVGEEAVPYQAMGLSLTYDHRAVDGAPASRFMQALCQFLENFTLMMAK